MGLRSTERNKEAQMRFEVYGPFMMQRKDTGLIDNSSEAKKAFWCAVDEEDEGLSEACGCYVFAWRHGNNIVPWYVGKTNTGSFKNECFQYHKLGHYNDIAAAKERGNPVLFIVAELTPTGLFANPSPNRPEVDALENILIGIAYAINRNLCNIKGVKILQQLYVPAIINPKPGKTTAAANLLRQALGI